MKKTDRPGEEALINFLIDPEALSEEKKTRIQDVYESEIRDWQELVGEAPFLPEARWQKIKAGFWQRAEAGKRGTAKLYFSLAAVTAVVLFLFLVISGRNPSFPPADYQYAVIMEDSVSGEPFENFVDSLMPVDPLSESCWFTAEAQEDQDEEILEDLLLLTSDFTGELS